MTEIASRSIKEKHSIWIQNCYGRRCRQIYDHPLPQNNVDNESTSHDLKNVVNLSAKIKGSHGSILPETQNIKFAKKCILLLTRK